MNNGISSTPPPPPILYLTEEEFNRRGFALLESAVRSGIRAERRKSESIEIPESAAIAIILENTGYKSHIGARTQLHQHIKTYRFDSTVGSKGTRFYPMSDIIDLCDILSINKPKKNE